MSKKRVTVIEGGYVLRQSVMAQLRGLLSQAVRWHELAKSPYGLVPAGLTTLAILVGFVDQQAFTLAGPNIAQDLNLNLQIIGGIFAIVGIIGFGSTLLIGWLGDRFRRTWLTAAGLMLAGVMAFIQSQSGTAGVYTTSRVVGTVADQFTNVPAFSLAADWYPQEYRGRVFSMQSIGRYVALLLGTVVLGVVIKHYGWRPVAGGLGLPLILVGVMYFFLKEPIRGYFEKKQMGLPEEAARREDPAQSFGEAWRATFSVRSVRRLFIANIFAEIGLTAFSFLGFFLADQYNLDVQQRALFTVPTLAASIIGGFLGGGLIDVFSRRSPASILRTISVFIGISLLGYIGFALGLPLALLEVAACFSTFGLALTGPALGAVYSQVIPPSVRTQGLQVLNLATIPGFIAAPLLTSIATDYGFQAMFTLALPFLAVAIVVIVTAADFFETDRRNQLTAAISLEESRRLRKEGPGKLLISRQVNAGYAGTQVLFGVDFDVQDGELIALLGTNGAGKSTLLRAISGTQEATDGAIIFDGIDITHKPPHEIAKLGVVHMPGGRGVFAELSVDENLQLATWMMEPAQQGPAVKESYELFPRLDKRRTTPAGMLSGGEQQMLALAMAFISKPRLLMIDELSLGLAPAVVGELLEKVKAINERGTTVIVVEQSVNVALSLAKRAVFLEKGEVKFAGETEDLLRRPDILRAVYVKGTAGATGRSIVDQSVARRRQAELAHARPVLDVKEISKTFGGIRALDGVSLQLREGEILGIVGPNGSGKTTMFDVISGYQQADSGQVWFDGQDVSGLSPDQRARLKLVRRFQDARLFPSLTVFEALLVALDQRMEVRNGAMVAAQLPPARRAERHARVRAERLIEILEIGAYRDKFVKELSTGLRRIVDLAFVLAAEPKVLLLDEPSSGIAQAEAESLAPLLRRVRTDTGCSILLIEHDIPLIRAVSDELIGMVTGQIVARGSADEVLDNPVLVEAFLGGSDAAIQRTGALT